RLLGYAVGGASVTAPTLFQKWRLPEMRGKLTGLNEVACWAMPSAALRSPPPLYFRSGAYPRCAAS
ncbi:hypothetical protein CJ738_36695, partial [Klebsiella pneumoniae]